MFSIKKKATFFVPFQKDPITHFDMQTFSYCLQYCCSLTVGLNYSKFSQFLFVNAIAVAKTSTTTFEILTTTFEITLKKVIYYATC